jgi:hypothetical protein
MLNTACSTNGGTPVAPSRILSGPAAAPEGGDGIWEEYKWPPNNLGLNGSSSATFSNDDLTLMLGKGFFSIHSGYGRTMIVTGIVIEPDTGL